MRRRHDYGFTTIVCASVLVLAACAADSPNDITTGAPRTSSAALAVRPDTTVVAVSESDTTAPASPPSTLRDVLSEEPTLTDHWHSAYGVYNCTIDGFEDPFLGQLDPFGTHSHQDGFIHIHPFTSSVTGDGANMEVFFDSMEAELEDDRITMTDGRVLEAGVNCGDEPAILSVARFDGRNAEDGPIEIITENLSGITFETDGEAFTIALAPAGFEYPAPPSIGQQPADLSNDGPVNIEDLANLVPAEDTVPTE